MKEIGIKVECYEGIGTIVSDLYYLSDGPNYWVNFGEYDRIKHVDNIHFLEEEVRREPDDAIPNKTKRR